MNKRCKRCGEIKPSEEFYNKISKSGKIYIRGTCKTCHIKQASVDSTRRRKKDGGNSRYFWDIKRKYGISKKEYLILLKRQNNKCAICRLTAHGRLCVDHDHQTNIVRGLLCHSCNRVLGVVKDNPELIRDMVKYLVP